MEAGGQRAVEGDGWMDAALGTYDRGHAHGRTGVARVGLEGGVHLGGMSACVLMVVVVLEELYCCCV